MDESRANEKSGQEKGDEKEELVEQKVERLLAAEDEVPQVDGQGVGEPIAEGDAHRQTESQPSVPGDEVRPSSRTKEREPGAAGAETQKGETYDEIRKMMPAGNGEGSHERHFKSEDGSGDDGDGDEVTGCGSVDGWRWFVHPGHNTIITLASRLLLDGAGHGDEEHSRSSLVWTAPGRSWLPP